MATVRATVCDIHLAKSNSQKVEATEKAVITVPAIATSTNKPRTVTLDVCGACQKEAVKLEENAMKQTKDAWASVLALDPKASKASKKSKSDTDESADDDDSADASPAY